VPPESIVLRFPPGGLDEAQKIKDEARYTNSRTRPLALVYIRVSTADQVDQGASLDTQRATLVVEAERRGWDCEVVADDGLSAKTMDRPGPTGALERPDGSDADCRSSRPRRPEELEPRAAVTGAGPVRPGRPLHRQRPDVGRPVRAGVDLLEEP